MSALSFVLAVCCPSSPSSIPGFGRLLLLESNRLSMIFYTSSQVNISTLMLSVSISIFFLVISILLFAVLGPGIILIPEKSSRIL